MVDISQIMSIAGQTLIASRLLLSVIIMPTDTGQERIDPAAIDRFSSLGLGAPETIRSLAEALCEVDYDDSNDQFLAAIENVLADQLSPTLPIPSIAFDDLERVQGRFSARDWSIVLDESLIAKKSESNEDLLDLFDTLAHELRHAEQHYIAARHAAAKDRDDETILKLDRFLFQYAYFPDAIIERAILDPSIPDSESFEFGKLISNFLVNEELREKKKYIDEIVKNPNVTPDEYAYYVAIINSKLPLERDATSIEKAMHRMTNACLEPW